MINVKTLEKRADDNKIFWWTAAVILGLTFRFLVLYVTTNVDFDNFRYTAQLSAEGKNIYANFRSYNYGILFSMICGWLYRAAQLLGGSMLAYKILHVLS